MSEFQKPFSKRVTQEHWDSIFNPEKVKAAPACSTCQGAKFITTCDDEHGMQNTAPCPACSVGNQQ